MLFTATCSSLDLRVWSKQGTKLGQMSIAEKDLSQRSTYKFMEELDLIFEFPVLIDAHG